MGDQSEPPRLLAMLSGGGRTLMNLLDEIEAGRLRAEVSGVVASRPCPGVERAEARGLPTRIVRGIVPDAELEAIARAHHASWIVLCGYLQRLEIPQVLEGRVVNIHPALLPKFGGPGMYGDRVHRAVLEAGEAESGCTVHLCDAEYDSGPIVLQKRCAVLPGDTVDTLAARVFEVECRAYPEALSMLLARDQATKEATR